MPDFKRLPGTARNYVDLSTGEVISRAERDKRVGSLFNSGFASYGARKKSLDAYDHYTTKNGVDGVKFALQGVTDIEKATQYMKKNVGASDTAFFSVRVKTKDDKWKSVATSTSGSLSANLGYFMAEYELDPYDIDEIEFVLLD